jgi:uncharacterized membrane protein YhaH (DUF805 family)
MFFRYGRINRPTYFLMLSVIVASYVALLAFLEEPPRVLEICLLLIGVPRLHDIGKSGWWAAGTILAEFIVIFGALPFAISANQTDIILTVGGVFVFVLLGLMIWLGCVPGQQTPNAYGDPPPSGLSFQTYSRRKPA